MGQRCSINHVLANDELDAEHGCTVHGSGMDLVGPAVAVAGISRGPHGIQEVVLPGQPATYYGSCDGLISGSQLMGWSWICCQWPLSATVWLLIFGGQFFTQSLYPLLGEAWCYKPSQISYIHSLYVMCHTLKNTWFGYLCCGWWIKLQPAVLFITTFLATPPRFMLDEDMDTAYLMTFEEYVEKKKETFPPFSGRYRSIDGGGNNARYTFIGQGGRGYAMNEPYMVLSPSVMPDAEAMQRALQMRTTFKGSPFGQNALATWFANVAIHDFFRSASGGDNQYVGGVNKPWVNLHSGYLDLQVLYGWNAELAESVRTKIGGKLDRVAETRFDLSRIPQSKVIVELMRREHNFVCDELAQRYPEQFPDDEALYQQARLIMGSVFINIILRQYGDQMFGENAPEGQGFAELRQDYGCMPSCGNFQTAGNHATYNFNLIYRWHTGIPTQWSAINVQSISTDDEMRAVISDELNWEAGGYGPNNMPPALFMRNISVPAAAVRDGRLNGAPRLNDFRRRFAQPYTSFKDMCGDAEVAKELAKWYPSVEDVELAVGCQVERCMQGGWALGQTVGQAILSDAFSSIRQDRFYTTDYTPELYTGWGYQHTKSTNLVDLVNRHLGMGVPRETMLARLPSWHGPPKWSDMSGFDARGFPILK